MLDAIRSVVRAAEHRYTIHAQERMADRRVTDHEVQEAILGSVAEIIEEYPADKYSPSCLIYGVTGQGRVIHVQSNAHGVIVTVYEPDPKEWIDLKRRRRP